MPPTKFAAPVLLSLVNFLPAQQPASPPAQSAATGAASIREHYTKFEYRIPARDGVQLFVSVYVPKDVFTEGKTYPVMMSRTPLQRGARTAWTNTAPAWVRRTYSRAEKFIFVYADVRGRYMSGGRPDAVEAARAR